MEKKDSSAFSIRDFEDGDFVSLERLWKESGVASPSRGDSLASIHASLEARGSLLVMDGAPDGSRTDSSIGRGPKPDNSGRGSGEEIEAGRGVIIASVWITDDGRRLFIHHMAVLPEWQGRGLGKKLMEAAVRIGAERGMQMKLEVARGNARAIALYRRFGFEGLGDYEVMIRREIG